MQSSNAMQSFTTENEKWLDFVCE